MLEIRLIMRAAHILAAAAWVGGSIFYLAVALPALRNGGSPPGVAGQIAALFKRVVNICMGVVLLSGAYPEVLIGATDLLYPGIEDHKIVNDLQQPLLLAEL